MNIEIFNKLKSEAINLEIKAFSRDAGKKQKAFIDDINSMLKGNQLAYKKALNNFHWEECEVECINNPHNATYKAENRNSETSWVESINHELASKVWWYMAHQINTDKARNLPLFLTVTP